MTHISTMLFYQHLQEAGISSHYTDYVFGTHTFPYWAQDLREFIVPLMDEFARPQPAPARVTYRSTDPTWTQWGWTVANHRRQAQAFTDLANADATGFTLTGSGTAAVTTPAFYVPGSSHAVTIGAAHGVAVADAGGRLHLSVPMTSGLLLLTCAATQVTIGG